MRKYYKFVYIIIRLLLFNAFILGEEVYNESFGYFLDLPEGWELINSDNPALISFTDPDKVSVLQIFTFDRTKFKSSNEIYDFIKDRLKATGEGANFDFNDQDAYLADMTFKAGTINARGYFLFINGARYDYAFLAYVADEYFDQYYDFILSALDTFSPTRGEQFLPGAVSQFYYPGDDVKYDKTVLKIGDTSIPVSINTKQVEATEVVIAREARILTYYMEVPEIAVKAWARFYRAIYRDNYIHFKDVADAIFTGAKFKGKSDLDIAKTMLAWMQGYTYYRTNTLADLTSPLRALLTTSGDCDSRGLVYLMFMHYFDIDAILLASNLYRHSLVCLDVEGKGARFTYEGKGYLIAELNDKVDIGLIAADMANQNGWMAMPLGVLHSKY